MGSSLILRIGKFQQAVDLRLARWEAENFTRRLWEKDPTLWYPEPQPEISDRLGWLFLPERMQDKCEDILSFAQQIEQEGFSHVLLLGMGGSSLAPEFFQKTFGNAPGHPQLVVLDTTHPAGISAIENSLDLARTLVIVSSKSGTTLETLSLFRYFWKRLSEHQDKPGPFFVAITDAGSPLEKLAKKNSFRRTFLSSPDVGGRYSAFTEFGLVPAALIGLDIQKLLRKGRAASEESLPAKPVKTSEGLTLGAALGELAADKDKLTIWTTPSLASFTGWLEQLLAESTGKQEKGIVPIVEEPFLSAEFYGKDRVFVGFFLEGDEAPGLERRFLELENAGHPTLRIVLEEKIDLGQELFRWELATASAGAVLRIHPFNQPDVQLAKDFTRSSMEKGGQTANSTKSLLESININQEKACRRAAKDFFAKAKPGDYVALQAYLPASPEITSALHDARRAIFEHSRLATTLGLGPRFLHSTGQLHKGGPNSVLAIQLTDEPEKDIPVPGTDYTFASLIEAQADGDFQALLQRKRRVLRIQLGKNALAGLKKLEGFLVSRE